MKKPIRILPVDAPKMIETQDFVYFNNTGAPLEVQPIVLSGDEADLRNAIQALEPLLSDADKIKYKKYLKPSIPQVLVQRIKDWRARNAHQSG
jgi:hypothetical protein